MRTVLIEGPAEAVRKTLGELREARMEEWLLGLVAVQSPDFEAMTSEELQEIVSMVRGMGMPTRVLEDQEPLADGVEAE